VKPGTKYGTDYLNVPVELCLFALKSRKKNQVLTYLYFKANSNGYFKNRNYKYLEASNELGLCLKTVKTHVKWLIGNGWFLPDIEVGSIRVISFELLASKLAFQSTSGVLLYKTNLRDLKEVSIAAVMKYFLFRGKRGAPVTELKIRSSQFQEYPPYPHLPNSVLAKILSKSKTTASKFRDYAMKKSTIKSIKQFDIINIPIKEIGFLKKYGPYYPNKIRNHGNRTAIQLPDKVKCNVFFRRKRNLRSICQENRLRKKSEPLNKDYLIHDDLVPVSAI